MAGTTLSTLTHLACSACGEVHPPDQLQTTCRRCGKVLLAHYDLDRARRTLTPAALRDRPLTMWRYAELLPVQQTANVTTLGEGGTPLLTAPRLGAALGCANLLIKDEGLNPTASFKARGLSMAVSRARELGAMALAIPSAGNAGSALAAYAARTGLPAVIFVPADTPSAMVREALAFGARVVRVNGLINDCGRIVREQGPARGWFDVSTLREPYRQEGKKTLGLELAEQGDWRLPDVIIYPTGGGTGIVGMWKAFDELEQLGLIGPARPKMIVVQAEGCAPIVRAYDEGVESARLWEDAHTVAPGMRVPIAIGDYLILRAVRASGGVCITVTDQAILRGTADLARWEGINGSPESGATVAGLRRLLANGVVRGDEQIVLFSCGSGLKHPELVAADAPTVSPHDPDLTARLDTLLGRDA
ncbi:MAG: threonine synthase [Chloroflexi bacterium]|nr:threonine synthase [Chloroflexota bacterium]